MSEFLGEARVVIHPDTTRFRAELEAQVAAATKTPVTVPVRAEVISTGVARGATQEVARTDALAAASQRAGVELARQEASTRKLASAQAAAEVASHKLAFAQEEVVGAASAVGAAQTTLTRSTAAAAAAQTALNKAVLTTDVVVKNTAVDTLVLARAQEAEAATALTAARAEAAHAATLGAVGKAAGASGASLLGLRGAVLTAGVAFLGATVAIQASAKAIGAATDTTEELNKSVEVFGDSSAQIQEFAETTATSLGISNVEALRATGIFGNLFRSISISAPAAAEMSKQLVQLAADLASFNNADPSEVLANIRSGLAGEPEPLRKFGIFLSQARVQQEALIETGKRSIKQLTQAEIVQARFNLILRDSAIASGDFERTSESLANQQRILRAELTDLGAQVGSVLIPSLTNLTTGASNVARGLGAIQKIAGRVAAPIGDVGDEAGKTSGFVDNLRKEFARALTPGALFADSTKEIADLLDRLAGEADKATPKIIDLAHSFPAAGRAAHEAAQQINEFKNALTALSGLEVEQLQIQTGLVGGGRAAEEENLRAQIEEDKRLVEAAASGSQARRDALEKLRSDQQELAALEEKDAQEAREASERTENAAKDALDARKEADRVLLDLLSNRRDDAQRRAAAAAATEGAADVIRAQDRLQALIKIQITKIPNLVKDEQTRKAAIRELRIALIASRAEEDALRAQQKADQQAQRTEGINLDIAFAETTGNVAREIAARERLIQLLRKQQKTVKKGTNEWKRLRNEIAEQQQAIKDAQKQSEQNQDSGQSAQQFFFEQLQAQQGFASNLLGNLITGPTEGLVGVPSPTGPGAGISIAASVQEGKDGRGPSAGQASTTNDLLQRILQQLKTLNGANAAPEATRQRRAGNSIMDGGGGNVDVM